MQQTKATGLFIINYYCQIKLRIISYSSSSNQTEHQNQPLNFKAHLFLLYFGWSSFEFIINRSFIANNMKVQEILREENYRLKNEITDLKNAFDLNRDILKILSNYNQTANPQLHTLMQIITKLTTINNQTMLSNIELIQQKNILKKENMQLNLEYNQLQQKLESEIQLNRLNNQPNESKILIQENINTLNKELMAANEQRIIKEQEIQYWKHRYQNLSNIQEGKRIEQVKEDNKQIKTIKRRYTTNENFILHSKNRELWKENRRLKQMIQELQNRLLIFIKAYNLEQSVLAESYPVERQNHMKAFQSEREQIRLLKYALNDIQVEKRQDEYILTITQRFGQKDTLNNNTSRGNKSTSWPKNKTKNENTQTTNEERHGGRKQQRRYCNY